MEASDPSDVGLIKDEIFKMFGNDCKTKFNRAIDDAVVQVYGESSLQRKIPRGGSCVSQGASNQTKTWR